MNIQTSHSEENKKSLYMMKEFHLNLDWYQDKYPEAVLSVQSGQFKSIQEHFNLIGEKKLYSPSPYFSSPWYFRKSKFQERNPAWGLLEDYFRYGATNRVSPHWLFNESFFLEFHPEVRQAIELGNLVSGYQYFINQIKTGIDIGRPSPLFNQNYYLDQLGRELKGDPFFDFIAHGNAEGVRCSPLFDPDWYSSRYPEIKSAVGPSSLFGSFFQHFAEHGLYEGRIPVPDFDIDYYIKTNPDVQKGQAEGIHPVYHFLFHGVREGRRPNRFFDTQYYLEHNPEVIRDLKNNDFLGPFEHFLSVGIKKNFKASAPLINLSVHDDTAKALYEKRCRLQSAAVKNGHHIRISEIEKPVISVIIPVFNHFDFTINLLQQFELITKANPNNKIEIIVVDNGSTDSTKELAQYVSGIKVLRFEQAMGYPRACNAGARESQGRVLLFLNNDIEILPGSLNRIIEVFDEAPEIGAVGGKIIKFNYELQEAGGIVWNDGSTLGYGRGDNPLAPRFQFQRDVDYCSGCFLAVETALFRRLGEFDEQFSPGYYEETDLCARIWKDGRRVVYDPGIAIMHYEYASFSKGRPETISVALMAQNKEKFKNKNRAFILSRPFFDVEKIDIAANRGTRKIPKVLFIEDIIPRKEIGSGFCRSEDVVREFLDAGWWITVWANEKRQGVDPIDAPLCEAVFGAEQQGGLAHFLLKNPKAFDLIWLCRTHNLNGYSKAIERWRAEHPEGKVVCDTEAIASVRHWLTKELSHGVMPDLANIEDKISSSQIENELKGHSIVDAFVAVSELDKKLISLASTSPVNILGHKMPLKPTVTDFADRKDLLFCGAIHEEGSPNYDSLIWFANKIAPLLKVKLPGVKLQVVGYWRPSVAIPSALDNENLELIGAVDELAPYFAKARVFVAPTRVAGGIPHKVHESMSLGLPAVVTPILASQLEGFGSKGDPAFFVADDFSAEAFTAAIVSAYTDAERWKRVRNSALQSLSEHCSDQGFSSNFNQIIESVLGQDK